MTEIWSTGSKKRLANLAGPSFLLGYIIGKRRKKQIFVKVWKNWHCLHFFYKKDILIFMNKSKLSIGVFKFIVASIPFLLMALITLGSSSEWAWMINWSILFFFWIPCILLVWSGLMNVLQAFISKDQDPVEIISMDDNPEIRSQEKNWIWELQLKIEVAWIVCAVICIFLSWPSLFVTLFAFSDSWFLFNYWGLNISSFWSQYWISIIWIYSIFYLLFTAKINFQYKNILIITQFLGFIYIFYQLFNS